MDYVYGHDEIIGRFVMSLIPAYRGVETVPPMSKTIGVIDAQGNLIAGLLYNNYDRQAGVIEVTTAALPGSRWLSLETIRILFQYPFLQLGCQMIVSRVAEDDERLLRQLAALNFTFIRFPRLLGRDKDAVICHLTREAWEGSKFSQRYRHHVVDAPRQEEAA